MIHCQNYQNSLFLSGFGSESGMHIYFDGEIITERYIISSPSKRIMFNKMNQHIFSKNNFV